MTDLHLLRSWASANFLTRNQLKQAFDAIRELMTPPEPPKRPIGLVRHEDKKDPPKGDSAGLGKKSTWLNQPSGQKQKPPEPQL